MLLHKMVQLLNGEKEEREAARVTTVEKAAKVGEVKADGTEETLQEKLTRQKAERKAAAEERSRQRQAAGGGDKAYFEKKKEESVSAEKTVEAAEAANLKERQLTDSDKANPDNLAPSQVGGLGFGVGEKLSENKDDPFATRNRPKIGGKYA